MLHYVANEGVNIFFTKIYLLFFPQTFRYEDSSSSEVSTMNTEDNHEGEMSAPTKSISNKRAANKLQNSSQDPFSSTLFSTPGTYKKL